MSNEKMNQGGKLERSGITRIIQVLSLVVITGVILFACAGRIDWPEAWAYLAVYLLGIAVNAGWSMRSNPEVINERGKIGENTKSWDKIITTIYTVLFLSTFVVAGLDARFGWSDVSLGLKIAGGVGLAVSMVWVAWVMQANTFLSGMVRIQDDRDHHVISSGPYQFMRHPMYTGMLLMFWGTSLLLGSWWALIPAALNTILFVIRTGLEDKTLQSELPGYVEYTQKVRYRLVPGVW